MSKKSDGEIGYQWSAGRQYFAAIIANAIMLGHGTIVGWVSPSLPLLLSEHTPLQTGPLTNDQYSWIGSIVSIGAIVGSFLFGYLVHILGCKRAMIFLTFPSMLFWFLVYFGDTYYYIFIARFAAGLTGGGIQTTIVLFVSEIANDNVRGRLSSFLYLSRNIGILLSYIIGSIVDYQYLPCIFVFIQIIYAAVFICLPNTPQFYLRRQQTQKAETSLKYYKGFEGKTIDESAAFNNDFERLKAIAIQNENDDDVSWRDFFEGKAIFGLMIGISLAFFSQFTGSFAILSYAVLIFKDSGSTIDPYLSSIIMALLQIMGNLCTTQLVDSLGRKILMIASLVGSAAGLFALALYSYLNQNGYDLSAYFWVPVISLSFVVFISAAGIISLSSVCTIEHLPSKVRGPGIAICTVGLNISAFLATKYFPVLMQVIDLYGCLSIFAICSIFGSLFVLFFVGETKGQALDELKTETSRK